MQIQSSTLGHTANCPLDPFSNAFDWIRSRTDLTESVMLRIELESVTLRIELESAVVRILTVFHTGNCGDFAWRTGY